MAQFIVIDNVQKSIKSIFNKNFGSFIIDNITIKCEISMYYGVKKKVLIIRQKNLKKKNYSF